MNPFLKEIIKECIKGVMITVASEGASATVGIARDYVRKRLGLDYIEEEESDDVDDGDDEENKDSNAGRQPLGF